MVGAVLVKDGEIIGQGWHEKCGEPHAERNALANCKKSPQGATLYVTLEPCCHQGRQPPCVDAILEAGIRRVVVGSADPNPLVAGKGIRILREHGIEVTEHMLEKECDRLNEVFFHYIQTKRPFVVMKYAMAMDGKIATYTGASKWITSETAIAQAKQELIKQGFQDWVWSDPERRERLCRLYNDKFNSLRPREYDGSHIVFSGMNPEIELREHQRNAVAHILYGGNTLLAHAVGAGKTFEMVSAAMESKRLGLCSKSLFVVPNHLTEQWASEFLQLYPSANILVATKKDFETKNRKKFCGRIATGDYDAIIIGHSQFEKIPMSIERQRAILEQQLDEVTEGIAELKKNRGDNFSVKQLERTKKSVKQKLDKLNDQSKKDDTVTFEELGVDRLIIDESHYYKNLFLFTKMRNVGGIAQTEAMKSSDLFMKCRYLDELTGGRGVVFATGTPISNSMVELYTIQRYLQYNTLVQNNLQHFDAWASTFGETITAVELTPEGYTLIGR